jgi:peptidoglycan/LPS O-acetylase OafA/YrhL
VFYIAVSVTILAVIVTLIRHARAPAWLIRAGAFSYTLYLVHFPLMLLILSIGRPSVLALGLVGNAALALLSISVIPPVAALIARYAEDRERLSRLIFQRRNGAYPGRAN